MIQSAKVGEKGLLPFPIKRVLVMKEMHTGDVRGGHTHHVTRQILFAISGSCMVDLDDGQTTGSIRLDSASTGVLLPPYVWHVMRDFSPGTVLLALADTEYDEKDYIREYDEFLRCITG